MAHPGFCQGPEGVAFADFDCCGGAALRGALDGGSRCGEGWKMELGSGADLVGVGDSGIDCDEFGPAIATP